ncbi:sister chromatid cohesion protein dcc1-like [Lichtheimia corymbifera JMRC:FSU:9682]|uniref:Sister chromatid cohesion protein dcc1-like n=1 Tax=Lichtheimia corymbifera JMRC:FSU:9682 TaxID=1263082 RepID=A0A068S5V4_9FUNG|nr:sister chromatid cohesion protein dcc1-like [Lichtheimia corymbifera JMRC:FSU:9682]
MPELIYSSSFQKGSFKLLELSNETVAASLEQCGKLVIKGQREDEAVLCTDNQTYSLHEAPTSNSLLLATPQDDETMNVVDDLSYIIEIKPCLPRLERITTLLQSTMYAGPAAESSIQGKRLYTYQDMLSLVQASEQELKEGLKSKHAFELDGYYRILDPAFMYNLLDTLANNATLYDIDLQAIPLDGAKTCIRQYPEDGDKIPDAVVIACLDAFGVWREDGVTVALDEYKVCRFIGEYLLSTERGKEWPLEEYVTLWRNLVRKRVQDIFSPDLSMLRGLYTMRERTQLQFMQPQQYLSYFPVSELPNDPLQRFARLFAEKKQWTPDEILPYIEDLAPDQKKKDALLLKYTRTQKSNGQLFYE